MLLCHPQLRPLPKLNETRYYSQLSDTPTSAAAAPAQPTHPSLLAVTSARLPNNATRRSIGRTLPSRAALISPMVAAITLPVPGLT